MRYRRPALIAGSFVVSVLAWTLVASWLFAWLGSVPFYSWWYYALPWPDDFLWDGAYLVLSGALATMPFVIAGQFIYRRQMSGSIYGQTGWADHTAMRAGGLHLRKSL